MSSCADAASSSPPFPTIEIESLSDEDKTSIWRAKSEIDDVLQEVGISRKCVQARARSVLGLFYRAAVERSSMKYELKRLRNNKRRKQTVAACVFIACRHEGEAHHISTFSQMVQMNKKLFFRIVSEVKRCIPRDYSNAARTVEELAMNFSLNIFGMPIRNAQDASTIAGILYRLPEVCSRSPRTVAATSVYVLCRLTNFPVTEHLVQSFTDATKTAGITIKHTLISMTIDHLAAALPEDLVIRRPVQLLFEGNKHELEWDWYAPVMSSLFLQSILFGCSIIINDFISFTVGFWNRLVCKRFIGAINSRFVLFRFIYMRRIFWNVFGIQCEEQDLILWKIWRERFFIHWFESICRLPIPALSYSSSFSPFDPFYLCPSHSYPPSSVCFSL